MKKQKAPKQPEPNPLLGWGYGYVIFDSFPDSIIGKILTLVEILGLPEKQEESTKSLIRQIIWNEIAENSIFISSERHSEIRKEYLKQKSESISSNLPMSAI